MKNKKTTLTLLILLTLLTTTTTITATDYTKENKTVTIDGITFDAPTTNNNTTTFTKLDNGQINWAYEDPEHKLTVYISVDRDPSVPLQEKWDDTMGIEQQMPLGDKWIIIYAEDFDVKDCVWKSLRLEE